MYMYITRINIHTMDPPLLSLSLSHAGPDVYLKRVQDLNIDLNKLVDIMWQCLLPFVSFFKDLCSYAGI